MMAKKTLWIGFSSETKSGCYRVYEHDPHLTYAEPYHLHPGNEVKKVRGELVRALNILSRARKGILPYRYCAAVALHKAGFRVRWDAKKGRFA